MLIRLEVEVSRVKVGWVVLGWRCNSCFWIVGIEQWIGIFRPDTTARKKRMRHRHKRLVNEHTKHELAWVARHAVSSGLRYQYS